MLYKQNCQAWQYPFAPSPIPQISRIPFKLACPFLPTMMWSCTEMPSGEAMSMIALVIWISACGGEGSYFGDRTLRINDASGATLDIIEPLALLTPMVNESSVAG
jgi:hypothetical protein